MIPLPPAELTVVRIPIADKKAFRLRIDSVLESLSIIKELQPGRQVLIKPSAILLNHAARESHQLLLAALVEAIQEIGGLVSIGDSPGYMEASTIHYWRASGLAELAERSGCTLFNFEAAETKVVMVDTRVYYLPIALQEFDLIINAACLGLDNNRHVAGVISNCLGFLPGRQISAWNEDDAAVDLLRRAPGTVDQLLDLDPAVDTGDEQLLAHLARQQGEPFLHAHASTGEDDDGIGLLA